MIKDRKDIEKQYKWDLSVIYESEAAFYKDFAVAEKAIKEFPKLEKKMLKSAQGLYNTLKAMVDLEAIIEKLWHYSHLNFAVDSTNNAYQALSAKVRSLAISAGDPHHAPAPESNGMLFPP